MTVWHQADTRTSQRACTCMFVLGSIELNPHSFSKTKLKTVGPFSSFPVSSLYLQKKTPYHHQQRCHQFVLRVSFEGHCNFGRNWRTGFYGICCTCRAPASSSQSSGLLGFRMTVLVLLHQRATAHKQKNAFDISFQKTRHLSRCPRQPYLWQNEFQTTCAHLPFVSGHIL